MRRTVMLQSRIEGELKEGWDPLWFYTVLGLPWTDSEEQSVERVQGHWFSMFSEPLAFVRRPLAGGVESVACLGEADG